MPEPVANSGRPLPDTASAIGVASGGSMTIASPPQPEVPASGVPDRARQLWAWLTRCDAAGCAERPVQLGRCARHAPAYDPEPDEYWGGPEPV
jgi:hypothetical protein